MHIVQRTLKFIPIADAHQKALFYACFKKELLLHCLTKCVTYLKSINFQATGVPTCYNYISANENRLFSFLKLLIFAEKS
jgi:hypothetical protein